MDFAGKQLQFKYEVIHSDEINVDMTALSAGIYILKIVNNSSYYNFRVVKK